MIEFQAGELKEINVALTPAAGPGILAIERFFVVTKPVADNGEFEAHCHIKNIGGAEITSQLHCIGKIFIHGGQIVRDIDELEAFTLAPGEVYDYKYGWASFRGDDAWVQVIGDWGEQTPRLAFIVGYHDYPADYVELVCTKVGADYAILRYSQRSYCSSWDFSCRTPPPPGEAEHRVSYPRLRLSESWTAISHAMLGLLSSRTYWASCTGRGAAVRTGRTEFNTI